MHARPVIPQRIPVQWPAAHLRGLGDEGGPLSVLMILALCAGVGYAAYKFGWESGVEYSYGAR